MKMENTEVDLMAIENDCNSLDMSHIYALTAGRDDVSSKCDDDENIDDDLTDMNCHEQDTGMSTSDEDEAKPGGKSRYKHVPHREKPVQVVQRRNARERRRVQTVNGAFSRLRKHIPYENRHKRLSKVKTLRIAIDYINELQKMLKEHDSLFDGLDVGNHMSQMLQTTLAASHVQTPTTPVATVPSIQDLHHPLPMTSINEHQPITTAHALATGSGITSSLFSGSGGLLDMMSTTTIHHQLYTQADWSNQKDIQEFLQSAQ